MFMINRFANRHAITSQKRNILYHQFVKYFHVSNLLQFNKYLLRKPFSTTYSIVESIYISKNSLVCTTTISYNNNNIKTIHFMYVPFNEMLLLIISQTLNLIYYLLNSTILQFTTHCSTHAAFYFLYTIF